MNSNLARLRYKGKELAYNKKNFNFSKERNIVKLFSPFCGSIIQEFGFKPATITGRGEFYGNTARAQYDELYSLFLQGSSGILHIMGQKPFLAYFASVEELHRDNSQVVSYSFKFIEDCTTGGGRNAI